MGTVICSDFGTNTAADDEFFFPVTVTGVNVGTQGWRAVDQFGNVYTGNYGQVRNIGAYRYAQYAGQTITLTITDVANPNCGQTTMTLQVPNESCSRECSIQLAVESIICDPNGTNTNPDDDVFYAWVRISGVNESFNGWCTDDEGVPVGDNGRGEYGLFFFGPYSISEGNHRLVINDCLFEDCVADVMLVAPSPCSDACELDVTMQEPVCYDNGTSTPTDDYYYITVTVMAEGQFNAGWRWRTTNTGPFNAGGLYGVPTPIGPFYHADGPTTLTIADNGDITCRELFQLTPPPSCSTPDCSMAAGTFTQGVCRDNGTPNDASDDFYTLTFSAPAVSNQAGTSYTVLLNGVPTVTRLYTQGGTINVPANGQPFTLTWVDVADQDCRAEVTLPAVSPCSNPCTIQAGTWVQGVCNDNGTETVASDDFYVLTYGAPIIANGCGQYQVLLNGVVVATRTSGQGGTINVPADCNARTLTFRDACDAACTASVQIPGVCPCSVPPQPCLIVADYVFVPSDNGTPLNPFDDTYTLIINSVTNLGENSGSWTIIVNGQAYTYPYGNTPRVFPNINSGQDFSAQICDAQIQGCCYLIRQMAKAAVGNFAWIDFDCDGIQDNNEPGLAGVTVTLTGTDVNGAPVTLTTTTNAAGAYLFTQVEPGFDYKVTFSLPDGYTYTAANQGNGANDSDVLAGMNGMTTSFMLTSGTVNMNIDAGYCPIPEPCDISIGNVVTACAGDGFYTITFTVTNSGTGNWTATVAGQTFSGIYGDTRTTQPIRTLANGGTATVVITTRDALNNNCTAARTVSARTDCDPDPCSISITNITTVCAGEGFYTVTFTVNNAGEGTNWTAVVAGVNYSGAYGATVTTQPIATEANGGTATAAITVTDTQDANCRAVRSVTARTDCDPDPCNISIGNVTTECAGNGFYTITFTVTNSGTGNWTATVAGQTLSGAYGATVTTQPIRTLMNGGTATVVITARDAQDNSCTATRTVNARTDCDPDPCSISITNITTVCAGNSLYTVTFTVNNAGEGTNWTAVVAGVTYSGAYGATVTTQPIATEANGGTATVAITVTDTQDANCRAVRSVAARTDCDPDPCTLQLGVVTPNAGGCSDSGTPTDTTDDTYPVSYTAPTVSNGCGSYEVLLDGVVVATRPNNQGGTVNVPADGDTHTLTFRDACEATCARSVTLEGVGSCSTGEPCDINATVVSSTCVDENTFTVCFDVTGTNTSLGWFATDNRGGVFNGFYNTTVCRTYSTQPTTPITVTFRDLDNTECAQVVTVAVPDCTTGGDCVSSCTALPSVCNDNGTPLDSSDDTYTTEILVVGQNVGSCFTYTINGVTLTGTYGVPFTVGPFLISAGNVVFTVTDCDDATCTHSMLVVAPSEPCSTGNLTIGCPVSNHFCPIIEQDIMLFRTDAFECTATVAVAAPEVSGACGNGTVTYTVQLVNMFGNVIATINPGQPQVFNGVSQGDYFLRYTVTDACGVTGTRDCRIRVADIDEPVAICNAALNVQLGGWGLARLYTQSVNNGSYDNCAIASIQLRRTFNRDAMTCDTLLTPTYSEWGPYVQFNCCDAGTYVMVEMRVTDVNGNQNICWSNVLVEDKTLPYCTGLADMTVACNTMPADFDPTNTVQLATLFGTPQVFDNCSAEAVEQAPSIATVGNNVVITRRFRAIDAVGNVSATAFEQVVTLTNCTNNGGGGGNAEEEGESQLNGNDGTIGYVPTSVEIGTSVDQSPATEGLVLYQNFPNPAVDETTVTFYLPTDGRAVLEVYDARGSRVFLHQDDYLKGNNTVQVDLARFNSGLYFYQVVANGQRVSKKMMVTKR
jgi:hypothetical protein